MKDFNEKRFYLKNKYNKIIIEKEKDRYGNIIYIEKEKEIKEFSMSKKYREYLYEKKKDNLLKEINLIKNRLKSDFNEIDFGLLKYKIQEYYSL